MIANYKQQTGQETTGEWAMELREGKERHIQEQETLHRRMSA